MSASREWFEKDYYAILGVPKNAPHADIKKAYRRLAQKHHPDANSGDKGAEERFKEISSAYDVLGDEKKRAEYDRVREMAGAGARFGPGGGVRFEDLGFGGDLGDLFGDLFGGRAGGRAGSRAPRRGADLETEVRISFEDAATGTTVPVTITGATPCATCRGSGAKPGTQPATCPECRGTGAVTVNQGFFSMARTCPRCGGAGSIIEEPCETCRGTGHQTRRRTMNVRIPAVIEDGARIRLAGRGEAGPPGAPPGDLYVRVRVAPHRFFGRRGPDLTLSLPVTFPEAALGAKVEVPTLNGSVKLKVPSGTESGKTFRIRGKGLPKRGGGHGDLMVTVRVEVPSRLSKDEKELLERFRDTHSGNPRGGFGVSG